MPTSCGSSCQMLLPIRLSLGRPQHAQGLCVDEGEAPVAIERQKAVGDAAQNVGEPVGQQAGLLLGALALGDVLERALHADDRARRRRAPPRRSRGPRCVCPWRSRIWYSTSKGVPSTVHASSACADPGAMLRHVVGERLGRRSARSPAPRRASGPGRPTRRPCSAARRRTRNPPGPAGSPC